MCVMNSRIGLRTSERRRSEFAENDFGPGFGFLMYDAQLYCYYHYYIVKFVLPYTFNVR